MNDIQFHPDWEIPAGDSPVVLRVVRRECEDIPVVVAEDDPISRSLVTALLEKNGFSTIVTEDGNQAMTAFRARENPCVAVVDWMMPGMDGIEVCQRLRESGEDVYIIMLTARGQRDGVLEASRRARMVT